MPPRTHSRVSCFVLLALAAACAGRDDAWRAPGGDAPPLVVLEHGYWTGGFDTPLLVAQADGRVLVRRSGTLDSAPTYSQLSLTREGRDSLLSGLGVAGVARMRDTLIDFRPGWSDQHSLYVLVATSSGQRVIQLRAAMTDGDTPRPEVPDALRTLLRGIRQLSAREAPMWTPDSIEVTIWPYEYAPDNPPLDWPRDWPDLDDPRWRREKNEFVGETRILMLPATAIPRLDSLTRALRPRQALRVGTRKWSVGYRWVFPAEGYWRALATRLEG